MSDICEHGERDNEGKLRFDLVSPVAMYYLTKVYTFGAEKYADRNWEKGLSMMGCFASMMRHAWRWALGETYDKESGLPHMAHAMWNAAAIVHLTLTRPECDDRVRLTTKLDSPLMTGGLATPPLTKGESRSRSLGGQPENTCWSPPA